MKGMLQPDLGELTWACCCRNNRRSWINSHPWCHCFVAVTFLWGEWSHFIFYPCFFSSLGYSGRWLYFPLIHWLVQIVLQLAFVGRSQNISFTHPVLMKTVFSLCFPFPAATCSLFAASEDFFAVTFCCCLLSSLPPWAAIRAGKQSFTADFELVSMCWCNNQPLGAL